MGTDTKDDCPTLKEALDYLRRGWCVIPIKAGTKRPNLRTWTQYQTKRPSESQVRKWFESGKNNIGLICGSVSGGLTVIDFDDEELYRSFEWDNPKLASTLPTVKTGRGYHVYCRTGHTKTKKMDGGGGEIKASGYVLAPPSIHPSGAGYKWVVPLNGELPVVGLDDFGPQFTQRDTENADYAENTRGKVLGSLCSLRSLCKDEFLELAYRNTVPKGPGERHGKIFDFWRYLMVKEEFTTLSLKELRPLVVEWHHRALPNIRTKEFSVTWTDFADARDRGLCPIDEGAVLVAWGKAQEMKVPGIAVELYPDDLDIQRLVCLCKCFQTMFEPTEKFYLGCRTVAPLLGCSHTTASKHLKMLVMDGVLELLEKGSKAKRKSSQYRCLF